MIEGSRVRLSVIGVIVMSLFSALFARLWFLQVGAEQQSPPPPPSNRSRVVYEPALRGRILDRNGRRSSTTGPSTSSRSIAASR